MVSRLKKYWPQAILTVLALFAATGYIAYSNEAHPPVATGDPIDFGGPGVGPADPWTSTTTPSDAITQRIWGRDIKLSGLEGLDCLGTDADGIVESGTCSAGGGGSGSVGTSTTDVDTQVTFFTTNGATPALIGGDSGLTYNSGADRLTVTYASSTGISSSYASSTLGYIGTLVLNTPLADASVSDTITVGASGSVNNSALSASVSLLGQTIAANELASADFGDFTCNGTTCTTDNGSIGVADLASVDFGDFTCNGSACALDTSYQPLDSDLTDLAGLTAATGDLIYGNGTGDWAKKAIGTGGQILAVSGGVPTWVATTTAGTGLTYSGGAFNVNTSQNIATLSNLTSNGFVRTGSGNGTLSVQTDPCTYAMGCTGTTTGVAGQLAYYGASAYQAVATGTVSGSSQISVTAGRSAVGGALAIDIVGDSIGDTQLAFNTGQNLTTASSPTFANITDSGLTSGRVTFAGASGILSDDSTFLYDSAADRVTSSYASTTGLSTSYASSTVWRGGGLTTDCDTAGSSKLLWDITTGQFSCGSDQTGAGGGSWPFDTGNTTYGTSTQSTTTPLWLKGNLYSLFASSTAVFDNASTSRLTVQTPNSNTSVSTGVNLQTNRIQIGPLKYPADYVTSCATCNYVSFDKTVTGDDVSIIFRDQGNARAEVGLIGNNDLVFKTISGNYLSESFSTRLRIEGTGSAEPGNVGIGLGETDEASDLLSVGTGNAFTVDYVGNVTASTSITINNPANGNAVLSVLGQQQSGGGSYIRVRDSVLGTYGYFGQNSVINGGTAYAQLDIQNPQSSGTICLSAGGRASATAGASCDVLIASTSATTIMQYASTTALSITGISTGNCLQTGAGGIVTGTGSACGSGGGAADFTFGTLTFGTTTAATTTSIWTKGAFFASSTVAASQLPYASTTALTISGSAYIGSLNGLLKGTSGLVSAASAGTDYVAGGTGANTQLTYFTGSGAIAGDAGLTYAASTDLLTATFASSTSLSSSAGAWFATGGGKVGIGTSSPLSKLSIQGIAGDTNPIFSVASSTGADVFKVLPTGTTTVQGLTAATSSAYIFSTSAGKGGAVILEDADGAGCTEVSALNGVLSAKVVTCPTEI